MTLLRRVLAAAAAATALGGCGLLLPTRPDDSSPPPPPEHYLVEGEVRDYATFAPVPGAVIEVTSDVPGYAPSWKVDDRAAYTVRVDARLTRNSAWEQWGYDLFFGNSNNGELWVREVAFRARQGDRCSDEHRFRLDRLPTSELRLWLRPCRPGERERAVRVEGPMQHPERR